MPWTRSRVRCPRRSRPRRREGPLLAAGCLRRAAGALSRGKALGPPRSTTRLGPGITRPAGRRQGRSPWIGAAAARRGLQPPLPQRSPPGLCRLAMAALSRGIWALAGAAGGLSGPLRREAAAAARERAGETHSRVYIREQIVSVTLCVPPPPKTAPCDTLMYLFPTHTLLAERGSELPTGYGAASQQEVARHIPAMQVALTKAAQHYFRS